MKKEVIFLVSILILTTFVSADILSINSGGSPRIIVNPAEIIEGFFFQENEAPIDPSPVLVSANLRNESDANLNCSFYLNDPDNDYLNISIKWYESDVEQLTLNSENIANGTNYLNILLSDNLTLEETWKCSARIYDGHEYSNWVDSNELTIIDITNPNVTIISPISSDIYNYTTLDIDFNISISENENISTCLYSLDGDSNITMNEVNNSYFWYEPNIGPGPHEAVFYCNDTSNNWGTNSTMFEILNEAAISILLSDSLSEGVKWNIVTLPVNDLDAIGNNALGPTEYYLNISATNTLVDIYVKADGDLLTTELDVLGLGNETYSISLNDSTVNVPTKTTMTTSYNLIGSGLDDGDAIFMKFFIDAPPAQAAGEYLNNLQFKAVRNGQSI